MPLLYQMLELSNISRVVLKIGVKSFFFERLEGNASAGKTISGEIPTGCTKNLLIVESKYKLYSSFNPEPLTLLYTRNFKL